MIIQGMVFFALLFFSESGTARLLLQAAVSGTRAAQQGKDSDDVPLNTMSQVGLHIFILEV